MCNALFRKYGFAALLTASAVLAGCAVKQPVPAAGGKSAASAAVTCQPALSGDALVGNWLGVRKQRGIVGELHVLFTLMPDGTMAYSEQLRRGNKPRQSLNETGCWRHEKQTLVLKTTQSNGAPIELDDPIYQNQYTIRSQSGNELVLQSADGRFKARRMPNGYRMPF